MLTSNLCASLVLLIALSHLGQGSLLINDPFGDFVLRHRQSIRDLVNWDPFEHEPFTIDPFFHHHDWYFPTIHSRWLDDRMRVPEALVTRNDKTTYQLSVDVEGFDPKELSLRLVGRELTVTGIRTCAQKHRKPCFQRHLCWRRTLPEDVDLATLRATLTESNVLEVDATKDKACGGRNIQISVSDRPEHQGQRKTEDDLKHAYTVRKEPIEEEVSVEVVPDDKEDLNLRNN